MNGKLTLVLGGAASGKSAWAEERVENLGLPMIYIATAEAGDGEMSDKIARHRARRGPGWETLEHPLSPEGALRDLSESRAVLLDCATMWLTNHLVRESDLARAEARLLDGLAACRADVTVVTNEVGQGIVPENALARSFREAQGRLNIRLAQAADTVVQVVAGLPVVLKGQP